MTHAFPLSPWNPTAEEYFSAIAPHNAAPLNPDGPISPSAWKLHGSGSIKGFEFSPRVYWDQLQAQFFAHVHDLGGPPPTPLARAILKSMEAKRHMLYGTAVEIGAFQSGEEIPEGMAKSQRTLAGIRAEQIRNHKEAGKYYNAPGSALQVAHFWKDADSDLWLRARWDCCYWSGGRPAVLDSKAWSGVTTQNVWRKVRQNGADIQAASYRRGAVNLWNERPPHTLVIGGPGVCDKIYVRKISETLMQEADDRLSFTLERMAKAYETTDFSDPEEAIQEIK